LKHARENDKKEGKKKEKGGKKGKRERKEAQNVKKFWSAQAAEAQPQLLFYPAYATAFGDAETLQVMALSPLNGCVDINASFLWLGRIGNAHH